MATNSKLLMCWKRCTSRDFTSWQPSHLEIPRMRCWAKNSQLKVIYSPGQTSLGQYCNIHIFLSFLSSLLKQCILFEIFLQFSLPPPYTKLKLGKNSGYTRPTLFVGWGEGLDLRELENAPETQTCPKTFVYDCRRQYEFIASLSICIILNLLNS